MSWKPLILCVDDTASILEGQKMLLEENGYRVLTAMNGTDAVQAFLSHSVDLVLLDYHMPGINGAVAAARMKDSNADVPIALVSGDEDVPTSDREAVDCFLSKSEPIGSFLEKVDHLLSLRLLFRPFDRMDSRLDGRSGTSDTRLKGGRLHGIPIKNEGIQKTL